MDTLQNIRFLVKKWKVDHKNVFHRKVKQLHFNVAQNDCDLNWIWSQMKKSHVNVVSNKQVTKERDLKRTWSRMNLEPPKVKSGYEK